MHPWNEPILEALRKRLDALPHALLVHGPQGVGKVALAEAMAQLVLCESKGAAKRPCGACEGCRWLAAGSHPDFRRVEPESLAPVSETAAEEGAVEPAKKGKPSQEIKVSQIRALADFLNVGSHRGGRRVALVRPAEDMNANAANALLKGLEEPPGSAMFILVSSRPARLLPTIRSRCVPVPVPLPPAAVALSWLKSEGVEAADRWLAYAGGAPLRAREYADQAENLSRLIAAVSGGRGEVLPDTREDLEALAEALQRLAVDRALGAFALPARFGTPGSSTASAAAWVSFARRMGEHRALARHPLNPRLFAAQMLGDKP